jgi:hypothetical protein
MVWMHCHRVHWQVRVRPAAWAAVAVVVPGSVKFSLPSVARLVRAAWARAMAVR